MAHNADTAPVIPGEEAEEGINIQPEETKQLYCVVGTPANHLDGFTLALIDTPPPIYVLAYSDDHAREIACKLVDPIRSWDKCPFAWTVEMVPVGIEVQ